MAARLILGEPPLAARLLVIVDQFEEIFTLCTSADLRSGLIDNLLGAVAEPGGPVVVVLAMRADFYGHCAGYRGLADLMARRQKLVGAMNPEELRWAIEKPARRCGGTVDPGLVELLLQDTLGRMDHQSRSERPGEDSTEDSTMSSAQPGHLPLLEFALSELWGRRVGGRLTTAAYREIDGLVGALERHADAILAQLGREDPANETICRRSFLELGPSRAGHRGHPEERRLPGPGHKSQGRAGRPDFDRCAPADGRQHEHRLLLSTLPMRR